MRTKIVLPARLAVTETKRVIVAVTFISGNFWRNCYKAQAFMVPVYVGWIVAKVFSRLRIRCAWHDFGENERIVLPWITTSSAVVSDNTTRKASWRRRNVVRDWCISSAILTVCKEYLSIFLFFPSLWPLHPHSPSSCSFFSQVQYPYTYKHVLIYIRMCIYGCVCGSWWLCNTEQVTLGRGEPQHGNRKVNDPPCLILSSDDNVKQQRSGLYSTPVLGDYSCLPFF